MDEARAKQIVEAWETTLHSTSNHDASRGDLIRRITEALTAARTEAAAADMAQRCAEVARVNAEKWQTHGAGSVPDDDTQAYFRGGVNGSYEIEKAILALSPDPDFSSRIRRDASWQFTHERDAELIRRDGLMCEQHLGLEFEHDPDCAGPGHAWVIEGKETIQGLLVSAPIRNEQELRKVLVRELESKANLFASIDGWIVNTIIDVVRRFYPALKGGDP